MTKHMMLENWMRKVTTYSRKIFIALFEWMALMVLGLLNIFFQRTKIQKKERM